MAKKAKKTSRKKKKSPHSKKQKRSFKPTRKQKVLWGSFFMLLSLALIIAFVSFMFNWKVDQSALGHFADRSVEAENWLSKFGAAISSFFMYRGFGIAAFSLAVLTGLSGIYLFFDLRKKNLLKYWTWGLIVMIWFSTALGFFAEKNVL